MNNHFFSYLLLALLFLGTNQDISGFDEQFDKKSEEAVWEMTEVCWNLREKDPDSALSIGLMALNIAEEMNMIKVLPQINGYIGVIYFHYKYDLKNAIPYLQESLRRSMEVNDSTRLAYSYNNLGDVFMMSGKISLALKHTEESIRIFKELENQRGIAYGFINLGLIYQEEKKYEMATDYFQKALDIRERIGDSTGYASAIYQLARSQQSQGELEMAMENYLKSYNYHVAIDNLTYTAYCLNGIATIYYLKGKYEQSLENYLKAIELHRKKGHKFGLIEDYLGISMVYAELGMKDEGASALEKALDISTKLEMHPKVLETYQVFAQFYQKLNNKEAAIESLNKFVVLYDSILFPQQLEVLEEVQENYKMQQSLKLAQKELEAKAMERRYLLIIIFLMIIIVAIIVRRLFFQSQLNKKLKEANSTKDKLFSVISHDLRSPFSTLVGFSELLKLSLEDKDDNSRNYAESIHQQATETLRVLDNLLAWSRTQSDKIVFNPQPILINELFDKLNTSFENIATYNKVKLYFDNKVQDEIVADKNILSIVLTNLISNALKFTPDHGKIEIITEKVDNKIILTVKDNGIGMNDQTVLNLQEKNSTYSKKGVRNEGGTGLGLNICKDLLELHNAEMTIESKVGKGTSFRIIIPVI